MKTHSVLFIVCISTLYFTSCNTKVQRAKQYHDRMVKSAQAVVDRSLDFGDALQSYEKNRSTSELQEYRALVDQTAKQVQEQGRFGDDTVLVHYTLELLAFYQQSLGNTFQPFLSLVKENSFSDAERRICDSLIADMTMMENRHWARFDWAEKKFYYENELSRAE